MKPAVEGLGYEFVGVEWLKRSQRSLVRVYIDGPQGVSVDDCARVSHQVSGVLDVEDPVPGEYDLEVSSPGWDRPLFSLADFERFAGHAVRIRMTVPIAGQRNFTGMLLGIAEGKVIVDVEGQEHALMFEHIGKARLLPEH